MRAEPVNVAKYLKPEHIANSQKLYAEYYRDQIANHGITVKYFRKDVEFPKNINDAKENLLYGESYSPTWSMSAELDIYLTVDSDSFIMNRYGIIPNQTGVAHFMIDEFNFAFPLLASVDTYSVSAQLTGEIDSLTGNYSIPVSSEDGWLSGELSGDLSLSAGIPNQSQIEYNVPFNYYDDKVYVNKNLFQPNTYNYTKTAISNVVIATSSTIDASGNGSFTSSASGNIFFNRFRNQDVWKKVITPLVGDWFEIQFSEDNKEHYEIVDVINHKITDGGTNPLLEKYVWSCNVTRKTFSDADGLATGAETLSNDDVNLSNNTIQVIANTIFDYSKEDVTSYEGAGSDKVYGGYGGEDSFPDEMSTSGMLFNFNNGGTLWTDGDSLVWHYANTDWFIHEGDNFTSTFAEASAVSCTTVKLKSDGDNIFFVDTANNVINLTDELSVNPYLYFDLTQTKNSANTWSTSGDYMPIGGKGVIAINNDSDRPFFVNLQNSAKTFTFTAV